MRFRVQMRDGVVLLAEDQGPVGAPTVLFLNSIGCRLWQWDAQLVALRNGFRCLTFDARGHGGSEAPPGDYTLEQLGNDAVAVLDAAGVHRAHVCGLSLGGMIGQWLGVRAPERIASLTLANTASRIGTHESWEMRRQLVLREGLAAIADMAMERFFSSAFRAGDPATVEQVRAALLAGPAAGYAGCCAALRDADLTPQVGRIAAPTLVLGGEVDVSTTPDQVAVLAAAIPGARLAILPAGHLSNLERPAAFTGALRAHLEEIA
jgi:3-oxoadipate enol-lactonase